MSNEMIIKENGGYLAAAINLADLFSEEMDGLTPTFDRIKIPAGGGISYEVPGDDPSNPDSVKEFQGGHPVPPSHPQLLQGKVHWRQQPSRLRQYGRQDRRCGRDR